MEDLGWPTCRKYGGWHAGAWDVLAALARLSLPICQCKEYCYWVYFHDPRTPPRCRPDGPRLRTRSLLYGARGYRTPRGGSCRGC